MLAPAAVILLLWLPVLTRYSISVPPISDSVVEAARTAPTDALLREVRDFHLLTFEGRGPETDVFIADKILQGMLVLPGRTAAPISVPFSPDDLDGLPPNLQLWFAGYGVPDVLLSAYVEKGSEEFFAMARDAVIAWDRHERSTRFNRGYLWNDHATAARVRVLGEFWRIYRQRPDYRPEVGRLVLEQAARYRAFLSDPGQFTFATNHGLMENLALLQLELAFPTLPDGAAHTQLALDRTRHQLSFLVDEDGVVRENSAGYQAFGLEVLGMTFRSMTLLGKPVPVAWTQKYQQGLAFLDRLERPDGTLPAVGDTDGSPGESLFRVTDVDANGSSSVLRARTSRAPDRALSVLPVAGYWIDWDGLEAWPDPAAVRQTVVTWTSPPAPSHKHADELGVDVWSNGISWLTGVGYWPYGEPGREAAESWSASNAPHLANEDPYSPRSATLVSSGWTPEISVIDLERRGPGAYVARRQVVHLKPDLWVILDNVAGGAPATNETVWTLSPAVTVQRAAQPGAYLLGTPGGTAARLTLLGSPGTLIRDDRGSLSPFAGWQVVDGTPEPAPAMTVEQPAGDAWSVTVLSTAGPGSPLATAGGEPRVDGEPTPDAWVITLPTASGDLTLTRAGGEVAVERAADTGTATARLTLASAGDASSALSALRAEFTEVAVVYPQFQERTSARAKTTLALLALAAVQTAVLLGVRRLRPRLLARLMLVSLLLWVVLGVSIESVVLPSWEVLSLG